MTKTQMKQEAQANVIHAAMTVLYREDLTDEERDEARKQIGRIEKMFNFEPFSFSA